MLRAHTYNVELLGDFFKTTIQVELVHERFDVQNVWDVVRKVLLKILSRRWQIFIHHEFEEEAEVLVSMEADPGEAIVEDQA